MSDAPQARVHAEADDAMALTATPGLRRAFRVIGGPIGKKSRIFLEGHEITHLVRSYSISASMSDVITVNLELIGLELR